MAERVIFEFRAGDVGDRDAIRMKATTQGFWPCRPIAMFCGDFTRARPRPRKVRNTLDALERMYQELYGTDDEQEEDE